MVVKEVSVIPDLNLQQIELQKNLQKVLMGRSIGFGYN